MPGASALRSAPSPPPNAARLAKAPQQCCRMTLSASDSRDTREGQLLWRSSIHTSLSLCLTPSIAGVLLNCLVLTMALSSVVFLKPLLERVRSVFTITLSQFPTALQAVLRTDGAGSHKQPNRSWNKSNFDSPMTCLTPEPSKPQQAASDSIIAVAQCKP